jgi:tetratricopeptide (TPR) repeat protein
MGQAPLFLHASAIRLTGDYDQAAALFEQSLELNRKIGDQGMVAAELQNLGFVEIHRGNVEAAERYFTEGEKIVPAGDPYSTAMSIINKAVIAFLRGNKDESRTLLEHAQSVFKEAGIAPGADDQFEIDWLHVQLTKGLRE